ncbi:hypothetical protein OJF2_53190 [Aquisphaera giovannonii]|uniref:Integral membrane protein n=1 Tax=Aquisphaera giovannonii TaxID=406548 RepID=A0A5B9W8X0_9BACT|nr:hypothetical protein [Aquisphaera giovannonii]QEH36734.1 hypothetical protein OJF2_53190 [Aquisphaera giovannonii]
MKPAATTSTFDGEAASWEPAAGTWPAVRLGVVREAWRLYRRDAKAWSLTMLVAFACAALGEWMSAGAFGVARHGMFGGLHTIGSPGVRLLSAILGTAIGGFLAAGMIRMALAQIDGRSPRVEDLFRVPENWVDVVLASLLLGAVLFIGTSLFVIPGLIAAGLLMFTYPLILEARMPATGAMIQSYATLKGQWLLATIVHLCIAFVAGLGVILFGVGLLITGPLYALSIAVLYREVFGPAYAATPSKPGRYDEIA